MRIAQSPDDTLREWASHLQGIREPSGAQPFVDVMSDALVWPDETNDETPVEVIWALRLVRHHRTGLILGEERPHRDIWQLAHELFPQWVGFRLERCSPSTELAELYARSKRKRPGLG